MIKRDNGFDVYNHSFEEIDLNTLFYIGIKIMRMVDFHGEEKERANLINIVCVWQH